MSKVTIGLRGELIKETIIHLLELFSKDKDGQLSLLETIKKEIADDNKH